METLNAGAGRGVTLLKIAVAYLFLGLVLGLFMAVTQQFQLRSVHTHVNLLGWATLGLAGIAYCLFPKLGATRLGVWHFWLHNLGLPLMMVGLTAYHLNATGAMPLLGLGSTITLAGLVCFGLNVFVHLRQEPASAHQSQQSAMQSRIA